MSDSTIIRTPDHRVRVFISSTLQELADERAIVGEAVTHLRLTPVLFELGARPHPPRDLYRAYLDQSHIFIGIYWQKYGWIAPDMEISGIEDEYDLSKSKPRLVYIKSPAPEREPRLQALIDRIQDESVVSYKHFSTLQELHDLVENDLALLLTERFESSLQPGSAPSAAGAPASVPGPTPAGTSMPTGTVTFLYTDIESSTIRWEKYPDIMKAAVERHDAIMRSAIESNEGVVFRTMGDAFCAAFPTAQQALSAALSAQRALSAEQWAAEVVPVKVRMALHTGLGEIRDGDYVGSHLNRIARLLSTGYGGQVLLSQAAYNLVCDALLPDVTLLDLGEHRLKDLTRPEHIFQAVAPNLALEFPPLKTVDNRPNNLPRQATPLIGREKEIEEVSALVRRPDVSLVTLTGPGGTGKTRLGLQVAADLLEEFAGGVWFVDLSVITDPDLVVPTIAGVLEVKESAGRSLLDTLTSYLNEKQMLLVLDNFEQVVAASTQVSRLLASAPRLKVLVTSRLPLRLSGEREYPVLPLDLPDPVHLPPLEQLTQYEAVRLFIERAVAIRPDFQVTNDNAPAVAEICARLDGLPLAIELAAARIRLFPPQALLNKLSSRLKVLTEGGRDLPARQQTLRRTIEWSYDLLEEGEKQLFHRAAVFHGGGAFEALEAVCDFDGQLKVELLEGIEGLVSKSLMQQREGEHGAARFWMLETIHEYAREKLAEGGEGETLRRQHLAYYLALAEEAEPHLAGARQPEWLSRLDEEYDNIRAALRWARERGERSEAEQGLRLAAAVGRFWLTMGRYREGREHLEGALSSLPAAPVAPSEAASEATLGGSSKEVARARGRALHAIGRIAHNQGDLAASRLNIEQALEMARYAEDKMSAAACLDDLAMLSSMAGDYTSERSLREQSLAVLQETGDKAGIAASLINMGHSAQLHGDYATARSLYEQCLALAREVGNRSLVATVLRVMGSLAYEQEDYASARSLYEQSLEVLREIGDRTGIAYGLYDVALMADTEGDDAAAISLYKEGLVMHRDAGDRLGICLCLGGLGDWTGVRNEQGQEERESAARLLGAASVLLEAIGFVLRPRDRVRQEQGISHARAQLGDEAFEKVFAEGRAMSMEQAIAYALKNLSGK